MEHDFCGFLDFIRFFTSSKKTKTGKAIRERKRRKKIEAWTCFPRHKENKWFCSLAQDISFGFYFNISWEYCWESKKWKNTGMRIILLEWLISWLGIV